MKRTGMRQTHLPNSAEEAPVDALGVAIAKPFAARVFARIRQESDLLKLKIKAEWASCLELWTFSRA